MICLVPPLRMLLRGHMLGMSASRDVAIETGVSMIASRAGGEKKDEAASVPHYWCGLPWILPGDVAVSAFGRACCPGVGPLPLRAV